MAGWPVSIAAASAAFALTLVQAAVLARPASHEPHTIEVSYGDLDLTDSRDAAALYGRLAVAARRACSATDARGARATELLSRCVARAVADAVTRVDSKRLTALHRARESEHARS